TAVTVCVPAVSPLSVAVATPLALSALVANGTVLLSRKKLTVPLVTGTPPLVTVAVKVTVWPVVAGFGEEVNVVTVVLVAAAFTVSTNEAALAAKPVPLKVAVIVWVPAL